MCATLALNLSKSAGAALFGEGHFGWFDSEVAFEVGGVSRFYQEIVLWGADNW